MREIGYIKWFGNEFEGKDFGFIELIGKRKEIYVHLRQVLCRRENLNEDTIVTFIIGKFNGREEAKKVKLLREETDLETLKRAMKLPDSYISKNALSVYLNRMTSPERDTFILDHFKNNKTDLDPHLLVKYISNDTFFENESLFLTFSDPPLFIIRCIWFITNKSYKLPHFCNKMFIETIQNGTLTIDELLKIPTQYFIENEIDLKNMPYEKAIPILLKIIEDNPNEVNMWVAEIAEVLYNQSYKEGIKWSEIPSEILKMEPIWKMVPRIYKLNYISNVKIISKYLKELKDWLDEEEGENSKRLFVESIPPIYQVEKPFINHLPAEKQVALLWDDFLESPKTVWIRFSNEAKILLVYRIAKEEIGELDIDHFIKYENDPQIKALLYILCGKFQLNYNQKINAFTTAHGLIQMDIIDQASNSTGRLRIYNIIPKCLLNCVSYCEGKHWHEKKDKQTGLMVPTDAFCPRLGKGCDIATDYNPGATIRPIQRNHWSKWTLFELLENCGVNPTLSELKNPSDYVNRLAGWINRVEEIRERLKCSYCKQTMPNNYRFSIKLTARYSTTRVSCQFNDAPHDKDVYLNHCWGCNHIIDSRESKIAFSRNGYYLCIKCGSGPQDHPTFRQGDICPNCSQNHMEQSPHNPRYFTCISCNHSIKVSNQHIYS
jgi:cold shock CspA family protein